MKALIAIAIFAALSLSACKTVGMDNPCFNPGYPGPSHPCTNKAAPR